MTFIIISTQYMTYMLSSESHDPDDACSAMPFLDVHDVHYACHFPVRVNLVSHSQPSITAVIIAYMSIP